MAARVFHESGHADVASISSAYETLVPPAERPMLHGPSCLGARAETYGRDFQVLEVS